jgi:hypothetical protein
VSDLWRALHATDAIAGLLLASLRAWEAEAEGGVSTPSKPETKLSKEIQDALSKLGFWSIRIQSGSVKVRRGYMSLAEPGTPDRYVIGYGWLEIKMPGKKLSGDQLAWHARARELGERVEVAESVPQAVDVVLGWRAEREHNRRMGWDAR